MAGTFYQILYLYIRYLHGPVEFFLEPVLAGISCGRHFFLYLLLLVLDFRENLCADLSTVPVC